MIVPKRRQERLGQIAGPSHHAPLQPQLGSRTELVERHGHFRMQAVATTRHAAERTPVAEDLAILAEPEAVATRLDELVDPRIGAGTGQRFTAGRFRDGVA